MKRLLLRFALLTISMLAFAACGGNDPEPTAKMLSPGDDPAMPTGALDTSKTYTATFITDAGEFEILLFDDEAPLTVENFVNLANRAF